MRADLEGRRGEVGGRNSEAGQDVVYEIGDGVRLFEKDDGYFLLRDLPLSVLRINAAAFKLLSRCDGEASVREIASVAKLPTLPPPPCRTGPFATTDANRTEDQRADVDGVQKASALFAQLAALGYLKVRGRTEPATTPTVSVVVPVRNRPAQIKECVESLLSLDYPAKNLEIVVVDDGSDDETPQVLAGLPIKSILNPSQRGAAACRNLGWQAAHGEIIAFTDSDCRADTDWLRTLVESMHTYNADAIGGLVKSAGTGSRIDRYEAVRSPLYSGKTEKEITAESATSYLPTCNLLIKRRVLEEVGGFDLAFPLAVGEDVDLVWRIVDAGHKVFYVPRGGVVHNHRESLKQFAIRRAQYAASEAKLVRKHPDRRRMVTLPLAAGAFVFLLALGIVAKWPAAIGAAALVAVIQAQLARRRLGDARGIVGLRGIIVAIVRGYLGFMQYMLWTISQYYVLPLLVAATLLIVLTPYPPVLAIGGVIALPMATAVMAHLMDRPDLDLASFIGIFCLEKASFQVGSIGGCIRQHTVGPMVPRIRII